MLHPPPRAAWQLFLVVRRASEVHAAPDRRGMFVNAAEMVRRLCLARTPMEEFFNVLRDSVDAVLARC